MKVVRITCDRCGDPARLTLRVVGRTRRDLCDLCYDDLLLWFRRGPEGMTPIAGPVAGALSEALLARARETAAIALDRYNAGATPEEVQQRLRDIISAANRRGEAR